MSSEVLVDALPYYDTGYDEAGVREAVSFIYSHYILLTYTILNINS